MWWEEIDILEPPPVQSSSFDSQEGFIKSEPASHSSLLLPSPNPPSSLPLPLLLPPISCYYAPHPSSSSPPLFMKSLLSHLPFAPRRRTRLYEHAEEALRMIPGPCFSWRVWKERAEGIWRWVECEGTSAASTNTNTSNASCRTPTDMSKTDAARTIFFGPPPAPPPSPPPSQKSLCQTSSRALTPSLPLFASVSGAFALALLVEESAASASAALHSSSPTHPDPSPKENLTSPALLHALSRQALCVWEGGVALSGSGSNSNSAHANEYNLDYVSAIVLGVLFVVLCDKGCTTERRGNIGKLVNIARTMGLDVDPDLTPGRYGLYESEARRRAWWDIWWWDAYTSTLSSRAPLIPLHAFSTRLPLDVDEEVFTSACTSAPLLSPTGKEGVGRWFGMRIRSVISTCPLLRVTDF
ncbi:hypothetical protein EDD22DRAFT_774766 [Suillus occidentalis]|nr:hypothetical protein EDD22DRAFT_774766 [Suillus occidentalis]